MKQKGKQVTIYAQEASRLEKLLKEDAEAAREDARQPGLTEDQMIGFLKIAKRATARSKVFQAAHSDLVRTNKEGSHEKA